VLDQDIAVLPILKVVRAQVGAADDECIVEDVHLAVLQPWVTKGLIKNMSYLRYNLLSIKQSIKKVPVPVTVRNRIDWF
jgi:hypothetical protein